MVSTQFSRFPFYFLLFSGDSSDDVSKSRIAHLLPGLCWLRKEYPETSNGGGKKAMDDKMQAEMMKMMGQMPADGKLPKAKTDMSTMMKGDAPPKKP